MRFGGELPPTGLHSRHFSTSQNKRRERSNTALHLTPPPPLPQRHWLAVRAVSPVSATVRPRRETLSIGGSIMLTFDEARIIAQQSIGPECALYDEQTIEKPYGWYFLSQSKEYMASGNIRHMLVGSAGFIVEKVNGHIVEFGSALPREEWFTLYEAGLLFSWYDLTILRMHDLEKTVDFLKALRLMYIIPEVEHGVTWKIPKSYTTKQIRQMLCSLPCTFSPVWFRDLDGGLSAFRSVDASGCCIYERSGHYGPLPGSA